MGKKIQCFRVNIRKAAQFFNDFFLSVITDQQVHFLHFAKCKDPLDDQAAVFSLLQCIKINIPEIVGIKII
jgi:hypothetical protein